MKRCSRSSQRGRRRGRSTRELAGKVQKPKTKRLRLFWFSRFETTMLKYIELKSGYADNGPAWIANVSISKTGRTIYFNGRALKRTKSGIAAIILISNPAMSIGFQA